MTGFDFGALPARQRIETAAPGAEDQRASGPMRRREGPDAGQYPPPVGSSDLPRP